MHRQPVAPSRDNIIAWVPGTAGAATLLFEAHQDTVPADTMTINPFTARVDQGRLWGRGACDVKGGMAAMLVALARLAAERPEPRATLVMACTVDEEHQFTGVLALVRSMAEAAWPRPDAAVIAEPTELDVVVAHKGAVRWTIETAGKACHSSSPSLGINAIYRMAHVVQAIERYATQLSGTTSHSMLGSASISIGVIHGGVSVNTVADRCVIQIDRRLVPGEDPDQAWRELSEFLARQPELDFPITATPPWIKSPALGDDANRALAGRLQSVIRKSGYSGRIIGVPFGTDASKTAAAGIPSVVFGPGSIAQAHTADEWIATDQLIAAAEIYYELARACARSQ